MNKLTLGISMLAATGLISIAAAQTVGPPTMPGDVKYTPIPFAPGAEAAYMASDGNKPEMYTLRVHLKPDAKIPPHTHPDGRMITILSGELIAGKGDKLEESGGVLLTPGSFFVVPAGAPHWSWAKNGDAVYQETGTGPTATNLIKQ